MLHVLDEPSLFPSLSTRDKLGSLAFDAKIRTVTFDLFDTLVFRVQGDFDSFLADLGRRLLLSNMLRSHIDANQFANMRRVAERWCAEQNRRVLNYSPSLAEIWSYFPRHFLADGIPPDRFAEFELQHEFASCRVATRLRSLVSNLLATGRQVVVISNSYYGSSDLRALLVRAGFEEQVVARIEVRSSSDYGFSKQHGLISVVLNELGVKPENCLHVGDSPGTDGRGASLAGVEAFIHDFASDHLEILPYHGSLPYRARTRMLFEEFSRDYAAPSSYFEFGYWRLGSIFYKFAAWLSGIIRAGKYDRILFAEREGIFLLNLYRNYIRMHGAGREGEPSVGTIPVSRAAMLPVVFGLGSLADQVRAVEKYEVLNRGDANLQAILGRRDGLPAVTDFLVQHVGQAERVLLVDLGYKGTIQRQMDSALHAVRPDLVLDGAYLIHKGDPAASLRGRSFGFLDEFGYPGDLLSKTHGGVALLEQCLMPNIGSVLSYDGGVKRQDMLLPLSQIHEQQQVQAGILRFVQDYGALAQGVTHQAKDEVGLMNESLRLLFTEPPREVSALFAGWNHEVNFGVDRTIPLSCAYVTDRFRITSDLVRILRGWTGPIRHLFPGDTAPVATALTVATSSRGVFFHGRPKIRSLPGARAWSCILACPANETLLHVSIREAVWLNAATAIVVAYDNGSAAGNVVDEALLLSSAFVHRDIRGKTNVLLEADGMSIRLSLQDGTIDVQFPQATASRLILQVFLEG